MIQKFLKLDRSIAVAAYPGICEATDVDGIQSSKERARVVRGARDGKLVWNGLLRHFNRLLRVTLVQSFEASQCRQVTELDRGIVRVHLFKALFYVVSFPRFAEKR